MAQLTICQAVPRVAARISSTTKPAMLNAKPMPWVMLLSSSSRVMRCERVFGMAFPFIFIVRLCGGDCNGETQASGDVAGSDGGAGFRSGGLQPGTIRAAFTGAIRSRCGHLSSGLDLGLRAHGSRK